MKKCYRKAFAAVALCFLWIGAYRYPPDQKEINRGVFESEISDKFTRGVTNVLWGWTEVAITPVDIAEDPRRGVLTTVFIGIPYGALRAVGRTLVGAYEVATCYAPQKPIFNPIEGEVA